MKNTYKPRWASRGCTLFTYYYIFPCKKKVKELTYKPAKVCTPCKEKAFTREIQRGIIVMSRQELQSQLNNFQISPPIGQFLSRQLEPTDRGRNSFKETIMVPIEVIQDIKKGVFLVNEIKKHGLSITLIEDKINVGPKELVTPDIVLYARNHKERLLHELQILQNFESRIHRHRNGCWHWTGALDVKDYPLFTIAKAKVISATRFSWSLVYGEILKEQIICKCCEVRICVNPEHMYLTTSRENNSDLAERRWRENG